MVRLAGLEPATHGLGNRCSIHLSYRRIQLGIQWLHAVANAVNPRIQAQVEGKWKTHLPSCPRPMTAFSAGLARPRSPRTAAADPLAKACPIVNSNPWISRSLPCTVPSQSDRIPWQEHRRVVKHLLVYLRGRQCLHRPQSSASILPAIQHELRNRCYQTGWTLGWGD